MSERITLREAYAVNRQGGVWPAVAILVAIVWVVMRVPLNPRFGDQGRR